MEGLLSTGPTPSSFLSIHLEDDVHIISVQYTFACDPFKLRIIIPLKLINNTSLFMMLIFLLLQQHNLLMYLQVCVNTNPSDGFQLDSKELNTFGPQKGLIPPS